MTRSDWLIWQLIDSAFPTGGFAHSAGLESARQGGQVPDEAALAEFLGSSMRQAADSTLPYVVATHANPSVCWEADAHCNAFLANPVVNRASRAQGNGLLSVACKAFPNESLKQLKTQARANDYAQHYAPIFGVTFSHLGVPSQRVVAAFLYLTARDLLSAAIRLNIVGPMRAQWLQNELAVEGERIVQQGVSSDFRSVAQVSPIIDMWQSSHDRLYSRLFQS